jgi:hypothetical protein
MRRWNGKKKKRPSPTKERKGEVQRKREKWPLFSLA